MGIFTANRKATNSGFLCLDLNKIFIKVFTSYGLKFFLRRFPFWDIAVFIEACNIVI